nr:hypothetical protein [uncultured Psychroserpens sp.]
MINCDEDNKGQSSFFTDNFSSLLDSTVFDRRKLVVPSPDDFKDSISRKKLNQRAELKKNLHLPAMTILIVDSIKPISDLDGFYKKVRSSKFSYESIIENKSTLDKVSKIDITKLKVDDSKYKLIYYSDFEKRKELSGDIVKPNNSPICSLSNIYFNKKQSLGAFRMSVVYSGLDGHGVIVFIKKENGNWVIDKIIEEWIA